MATRKIETKKALCNIQKKAALTDNDKKKLDVVHKKFKKGAKIPERLKSIKIGRTP